MKQDAEIHRFNSRGESTETIKFLREQIADLKRRNEILIRAVKKMHADRDPRQFGAMQIEKISTTLH